MLRRLSLFLVATATAAGAHDFWLQPTKWQVDPGEPVAVTLQVGHGAARQRSPIPARRILRFDARSADGRRIDLTPSLHIGQPADDATLSFDAPGAYVVMLETDNRAESHLSAARFNDYLKDEGVTPAAALRARTGRIDADGAENYSRHAKTIIQVGALSPRDQAALARPAGLVLELVPLASPAQLSAGETMPVRVYYRGAPLAGALVKLNDLDHDAEPVAMRRTEANGVANFAIPRRGQWQFNVIWTRPQGQKSLTDFDTSFSSLTFAINK
jgi:uncharacterized GH25 family protein